MFRAEQQWDVWEGCAKHNKLDDWLITGRAAAATAMSVSVETWCRFLLLCSALLCVQAADPVKSIHQVR